MSLPTNTARAKRPPPAPVLLIEDTLSLQMVYRSVLMSAGHQVLVASSAAEGLAAFHTHAPRVVLLDLVLPDRDGLDLMRDMLAQHPETCVIVITANGSINKAVEAMRAGAHDFLVKPFDEQRFLGAVENAGAPGAAPLRRAPSAATIAPTSVASQAFIGSSATMTPHPRHHRFGRALDGHGVHHRRKRHGQGTLRAGGA